jgi:hypothetical protein
MSPTLAAQDQSHSLWLELQDLGCLLGDAGAREGAPGAQAHTGKALRRPFMTV